MYIKVRIQQNVIGGDTSYLVSCVGLYTDFDPRIRPRRWRTLIHCYIVFIFWRTRKSYWNKQIDPQTTFICLRVLFGFTGLVELRHWRLWRVLSSPSWRRPMAWLYSLQLMVQRWHRDQDSLEGVSERQPAAMTRWCLLLSNQEIHPALYDRVRSQFVQLSYMECWQWIFCSFSF